VPETLFPDLLYSLLSRCLGTEETLNQAYLYFTLKWLHGLFVCNESVLVDTPVAESRWAQVFDGWVDESPSKHEHDEPLEESGEHDEGEYTIRAGRHLLSCIVLHFGDAIFGAIKITMFPMAMHLDTVLGVYAVMISL
jgi:hypothetical protein